MLGMLQYLCMGRTVRILRAVFHDMPIGDIHEGYKRTEEEF